MSFYGLYDLDLRHFTFPAAGLRRSFRLSRKDRRGSSGDGSDSGDSEYLTYEEVTRYQQRPHERPRLVVLIGEVHFPCGSSAAWWRRRRITAAF